MTYAGGVTGVQETKTDGPYKGGMREARWTFADVYEVYIGPKRVVPKQTKPVTTPITETKETEIVETRWYR